MVFGKVSRYIILCDVTSRHVLSRRIEEATVDKLHRAASAALSTMGARQRPFWTAFAAGLAAPTMVYDPPPAYTGLTRDFSVAASFAQVGALLGQSAREIA